MRPNRDQRGSVSILAIGLLAAAVAASVLVSDIGVLTARRARAAAAADAAALAAAEELALGHGDSAAEAAASRLAETNQARLLWCSCRGLAAVVAVEVDTDLPVVHTVSARARAVVGDELEQPDRSSLVEVLVPVAALR
jgi:secretion/DNA translocation related TadE-like protein